MIKDSDYYPYGNSTYSLFNKDWSADWGSNAISNGGNMGGIWRTLTIEEWKYLFEQRQTKSGILFAKAVVGGENGVILLPDNWDASVYKLKNTNDKESVFDGNIISPFEWNKIEAAGAVFLPAGGYRELNYDKTVNVYGVGSGCYYWSSSKRRTDKIGSDYTCTIDISNDHMWYWGNGESRGYSVRLVRPAD